MAVKPEMLVTAHLIPPSHLTGVIPEPSDGPSLSHWLPPLAHFSLTSSALQTPENTGQPGGLKTWVWD